MKNRRELLNRIRALETKFVPPDPWVLTVEYEAGRVEQMSAREYMGLKAGLQGVHVIDMTITGNLKELDCWLQTVRDAAEKATTHDCRAPTSLEEWELYDGTKDTVKI